MHFFFSKRKAQHYTTVRRPSLLHTWLYSVGWCVRGWVRWCVWMSLGPGRCVVEVLPVGTVKDCRFFFLSKGPGADFQRQVRAPRRAGAGQGLGRTDSHTPHHRTYSKARAESHRPTHTARPRSGLNAQLVQGTPYLFVIRAVGTDWRYSNHLSASSTTPFTTWAKNVSTSLSTYTTVLSDSDGTRRVPWFRLSQ